LGLVATLNSNLINSLLLIFSEQLNRRKKLILSFGCAATFLLIMAVVRDAEPFAPRYQEKTVNQWLDHYAEHGEMPTKEVIEAFGTNAFPTLIVAKDPPRWFKTALKYNSRFKLQIVAGQAHRAFQKVAAARSWGRDWAEANSNIELELLKTYPDDEFLVKVFDLTYSFFPPESSRLELYVNNRDKVVSKRAALLLTKAKRRSWNEIKAGQ
jgi:hypothetical protein